MPFDIGAGPPPPEPTAHDLPFSDDCADSPLDELLVALPRLTEPQLTELVKQCHVQLMERSIRRTAAVAEQNVLAFERARNDTDEPRRLVGADRGRR